MNCFLYFEQNHQNHKLFNWKSALFLNHFQLIPLNQIVFLFQSMEKKGCKTTRENFLNKCKSFWQILPETASFFIGFPEKFGWENRWVLHNFPEFCSQWQVVVLFIFLFCILFLFLSKERLEIFQDFSRFRPEVFNFMSEHKNCHYFN